MLVHLDEDESLNAFTNDSLAAVRIFDKIAELQLDPLFEDPANVEKLLEFAADNDDSRVEEMLLANAGGWGDWSYGGCGMNYTADLCAWWGVDKATLDRTLFYTNYNNDDDFLFDVQARVANLTWPLICETLRDIIGEEGEE